MAGLWFVTIRKTIPTTATVIHAIITVPVMGTWCAELPIYMDGMRHVRLGADVTISIPGPIVYFAETIRLLAFERFVQKLRSRECTVR